MTNVKNDQITLPEQLSSSVDLSRVIRELEAVDESLRQAQLRKPGTPTVLAKSSVTLEDLARLNNVSLTDQKQRTQLLALLKAFHAHAPRIHMSLATEPSAAFVQKIVVWMRSNLHPVVLLEIGLQPTLAAGCMIRTSNKVFDMSLRHRFTENRHLLVEKISEVNQVTPASQTVSAQTTAPPAPAPAPNISPATAKTATTLPAAAAAPAAPAAYAEAAAQAPVTPKANSVEVKSE